MREIKEAIHIASLDPKVAQVLTPLIDSYLNLEEKINELEIKIANESRVQKKTKAQKAYRQIGKKKSRHHAENERLLEKYKSRPWELPYKLLPPDAKKAWSEVIFHFKKKGKVPKYNKSYESLSKEELTDLRKSFLKKNKDVFKSQEKEEGTAPRDKYSKKLVKEIASISDNALNDAYGYGLSKPDTFGADANEHSSTFALQALEKGETDIDKIADAVHKGWSHAFNTYDDPIYKEKPEKKKARQALADADYDSLSEEEKEKDRVVARAIKDWYDKKK